MSSRRTVLTAVGLASAGVLTSACSSDGGSSTRTPGGSAGSLRTADATESAEAAAVARTVARAVALLALSAPGGTTAPHARISADHRAHLVALGRVGSSPRPGASSPATAAQLAAELAGATEALADVVSTSPAVAVLLTRIAAVRAVHADLLATRNRLAEPAPVSVPSPTGSLDPAGRAALAALIRGEHAAVFGYGVITARVAAADRARIRRWWTDHQTRRDRYSAALAAAGGVVPAALPAYEVGTVATPAAAMTLAVSIERALLTTGLNALAQVDGAWRRSIAADAVETARRADRLGGALPALPGE